MSYDPIPSITPLAGAVSSGSDDVDPEISELEAQVSAVVRQAVFSHRTPTPQAISSGSTTPQSDRASTFSLARSATGTPVQLRRPGSVPVRLGDETVHFDLRDVAGATGMSPVALKLSRKEIEFSELRERIRLHDLKTKTETLYGKLRRINPSIEELDVRRVVEFIEERKKHPFDDGKYLPNDWYFHRGDHAELFCSIYYDHDMNEFYLLLTSARQKDPKSMGGLKVMCSGISYSGEEIIARVASLAGEDFLANSVMAAKELEFYNLFDHPNVAKVICASELIRRKKKGENGIFWIMEKYEMLDQLMEKRIPNPLQLIRTAARGLVHIHERGYLHGDIKPANIGVNEEGELVILDLGTVAPDTRESYLTFDYTRAYIPLSDPSEPFYGRHPKNDVWALGAILFQMLTNEPWLTGRDVEKGRGKIESFLKSKAPLFEPQVDLLLRRALAVRREERLTSQEFLDGLNQIVEARGS